MSGLAAQGIQVKVKGDWKGIERDKNTIEKGVVNCMKKEERQRVSASSFSTQSYTQITRPVSYQEVREGTQGKRKRGRKWRMRD